MTSFQSHSPYNIYGSTDTHTRAIAPLKDKTRQSFLFNFRFEMTRSHAVIPTSTNSAYGAVKRRAGNSSSCQRAGEREYEVVAQQQPLPAIPPPAQPEEVMYEFIPGQDYN